MSRPHYCGKTLFHVSKLDPPFGLVHIGFPAIGRVHIRMAKATLIPTTLWWTECARPETVSKVLLKAGNPENMKLGWREAA
jgi:hypothetical protein